MVSGLGAAGSAGNASSLFPPPVLLAGATEVVARGVLVVAEPVPPIHDGCEGFEVLLLPGNAGKAADDDDAEVDGVVVVQVTLVVLGPATGLMLPPLPLRVLFFSFSTLVVCFC